ncbi:DUF6702 family protein [Alterisphingorhabdus coralli]|uniref:DUF6702 family protein n=1 Tax=Alterisphingorhabdus coralli TaxID=3071408 RepID=A0AA97F8R5_9SPHN|nr:DUF6702 family protein [Parasphingorhabdus sp. SCSIO 66989]WOE76464.1 DUF6702 family protein [Parasphingorhabdus sp. SCSIO 66989]
MTRFLIVLSALLLAVPAVAHKQKITISTVSHNPRTEMLEVVHRVPLHDAEHALKAQGIRAPDVVTDIESRRAFANYVGENFSISAKGEVIALTLLGTEIEGGNLIVLQEAPSPGPGTELLVRSQILSDIWSRQENRVNLGAGTDVNTLIFRSGDPAKSAVLP